VKDVVREVVGDEELVEVGEDEDVVVTGVDEEVVVVTGWLLVVVCVLVVEVVVDETALLVAR